MRASMGNRFRNILYSSSARTFATGDLISLDIAKTPAQNIRIPALATARLFGDLRSIRPGGQGLPMRVRRRVSGRLAGRLGHILIPQGMGFASRLMNKFYGRFLTKSLNNYYNQKVKYTVRLDGNKMTQTTKAQLSRNINNQISTQAKKGRSDLKSMGVNISHFNPQIILSKIQRQMMGAAGSNPAPVATGNLRDSIISRGFKFYGSDEAIIEGNLTIGGSASSPIGGKADKAPYWWKTVYGGYYDFSPNFIPPRNYGWFGFSVSKGLTLTKELKGARIFVDNGQFNQIVTVRAGNMPYENFQPPRPSGKSFELSADNKLDNFGEDRL